MNEFFQRLKQRKLVQWAIAYVAAAFALLQGIDIVAQRFGWPDSIERILIVASCIGFFLTLVLAWYHGERELGDIRQATLAAQRAKNRINLSLTYPLLNGFRAARLPEEISRDPEWLAVWSDPKLREMMELYRANLTAFRNGK